jgi:hypothetical protein
MSSLVKEGTDDYGMSTRSAIISDNNEKATKISAKTEFTLWAVKGRKPRVWITT